MIALGLLLINLAAFTLFGIDKQRAQTGDRRISEHTLLQVAAFGGTIGAYAGRSWFRHKTRKDSFTLKLHVIAMVQAGLAAGLGMAYFWPG